MLQADKKPSCLVLGLTKSRPNKKAPREVQPQTKEPGRQAPQKAEEDQEGPEVPILQHKAGNQRQVPQEENELVRTERQSPQPRLAAHIQVGQQ